MEYSTNIPIWQHFLKLVPTPHSQIGLWIMHEEGVVITGGALTIYPSRVIMFSEHSFLK